MQELGNYLVHPNMFALFKNLRFNLSMIYAEMDIILLMDADLCRPTYAKLSAKNIIQRMFLLVK